MPRSPAKAEARAEGHERLELLGGRGPRGVPGGPWGGGVVLLIIYVGVFGGGDWDVSRAAAVTRRWWQTPLVHPNLLPVGFPSYIVMP